MEKRLALSTLVPAVHQRGTVEIALSGTTFVGIDFGTSTTVASVAVSQPGEMPVEVRPVPFQQKMPDGRIFTHHLVPTAIAFDGANLFFGLGAMESTGTPDVDLWTGFKMGLGEDAGPFPNSALAEGHPLASIVSAQDAAALFLRFIREGVERYVEQEDLPQRIAYAVSVPAAFEANQRADLLRALERAGIPLEDDTLIDEPNAAFMSFLADAHRNTARPFYIPSGKPLHLLVFDFGAGTCDISVLEVAQVGDGLRSKNLAISRFEALGGRDIDRLLAQNALLPALFEANDVEDGSLTLAQLEKRVIPTLMRPAEQLKIAACQQVTESMGSSRHLPRLASSNGAITLPRPVNVSTTRGTLTLDAPALSFAALEKAMKPFLRLAGSPGEVPSVFDPVASALGKAGLTGDDLDLVLLVGGSAENPYVQVALHDHFGHTDVVVPPDLRDLVSRGVALHAFMLHGLGQRVIRPITSESLVVLARGGVQRTLVAAGTEMPSQTLEVADLRVVDDGQAEIAIPLCVGGPDKQMGVIRIASPSPSGFDKGTPVRVRATLSANKVLNVDVEVAGQPTASALLHPFSNATLTPQQQAVREATKVANRVAAQNGGRPSGPVLVALAEAYAGAGEHRRAAETLESARGLSPALVSLFEIARAYDQAGMQKQALAFYQQDYERNKTSTTAQNLAITYKGCGDAAEYDRLMEEALRLDPDALHPLVNYGHTLYNRRDQRGRELLQRALDQYIGDFQRGHLSDHNTRQLARAARLLHPKDLAYAALRDAAREAEANDVAASDAYREEDLLSSQTDGLAVRPS